jgi:signal transduction histidine kinase
MCKRQLFFPYFAGCKTSCCLLFLWCIAICSSYAQPSTPAIIDSLKQLLKKPGEAENPDVLNQLSLLYQNIDSEKSYQYAAQAYDIAEKRQNKKAKVLAIIQIGEYYLSRNKPQEAFPILQQAYIAAKTMRDTLYMGIAKGKMGVSLYLEWKYLPAISYLQDAISFIKPYQEADLYRANFLNTLSYIFSRRGSYTTAIEYAREALEIRQRIDPTGEMTARSLNTLGEFYLLQNNLRKAMEYFNSALQINRRNQNKRGVAIMLTNIGNVYLQEGNYKEANNHLLAALEIKRSLKVSPRELAITQLLLGKLYLAEQQPIKAYQYINQALSTFIKENDKYYASLTYSEQAKYFAAMGQFNKALEAHQQGIAIANMIEQAPLIVSGYEALAQTYLLMNDAENFFKYYKLYRNGKDSIDRELKSLEVVLMQEELDRRKQELQALSIQNKEIQTRKEQEKAQLQRNFFVVVALAALIVAVVVGLLLKARLTDKKRLEIQNQIISGQNQTLEVQKQELQELITAKDKLFSVVAHDIRSPLAGLSSMIDLLNRRQVNLNEEDTQSALQQISKSLANVYQLLNNLLDWARLQTGSFVFEPVNITLAPVAKKTVELFEPQISAKNLRVISNIPSDLMLSADKNMLEFILRNVISNAIKFTFSDKQIIIEAEESAGFVFIRVKDNGIGLSEEEAAKIFNLPTSRLGTKGERGAGIALSICNEFMTKHGGSIWATPNPEGGSIFHLKFPLPTA